MRLETKAMLGFRLQLSPTLCRVFGVDVNQLILNKFITHNLYYLGSGASGRNVTPTTKVASSELATLRLQCTFTSVRKVDMTNSIITLWVYTDIMLPTHVGDIKTPLLRTIPIPHNSNKGETCNYIYRQPFYYPLCRHTINDIKIGIYDTYGKTHIKFEDDVVCQFHFRKHMRQAFVAEGLKRKV